MGSALGQGPTLGVRFTEVSVKTESTVYPVSGKCRSNFVLLGQNLSSCTLNQGINFRLLYASTESGELFTWGKGKAGRLGHGDIRDRLGTRCI